MWLEQWKAFRDGRIVFITEAREYWLTCLGPVTLIRIVESVAICSVRGLSHVPSRTSTWASAVISVCLFVCLFVSLLSHFWLIHLFYLHLLYQPYVGLCQATRVQSHQRQSTSAVAIATCEVQVSAANYQTVPTVATGVSKPLCCRLTLTFTLTSENLSLYITLLL